MYITKEEWLEIQRDPDKGLDLINKAFDRVKDAIMEESVRRLPAAVIVMQRHYQVRQKDINEFHERNPDFKNYQRIVSDAVFKTEADNPAKGHKEILKLSEPLIRERIQSSEQTKELSLKEPVDSNLNRNGVL